MGDLIQRIRTDWHFLVIALTTTAIGLNFLIHPGLLEDQSAYAFIVNVLDDAVFSIPISVSGGIGSILFLLGKRRFRAVFLVFYQFFWMILLLAYVWRALNGFPNSTWIMALCINFAVFFLALWGDVDA
jgi:hypothetical protein